MMAVLTSAFANSSSSLMQAKMMGLTQDFITPPLSPTEQVCAFAAGRGDAGPGLVGLVTAISVMALRPLHHRPLVGGSPISPSARLLMMGF